MQKENLFDILINEQLSSVEFVQDYLQLHFDGNILTFYSWPIVIANGEYRIDNINYRNELCSLISEKVEQIVFKEKNKLEIIFNGDNKIILSLERNDLNSQLAEFLYFTDINNGWLVLD